MAVQAPQLYFSDNLGFPSAAMITAVSSTGLQQQDWNYPVCGLDDIFSCLPSPLPHQYHNFHMRQAIQDQNQYTNGFDCGNQFGFSTSTSNSFFSESLEARLEFQRHELDCIIQLQSEKLRFALHEQRKQQLSGLLSNLECRTSSLIMQKEEHLAQATKKAMELQDCLRKAEMENEAWQRVAKANETMVVNLNNRLAQVRERLVLDSAEADDAESSCSGSCDRRNRAVNMEERGKKLDCKSCKTRRSCVIFLPCRHLCSCKLCEGFLGSCPVCDSTKEASMEVFLV